MDKILILLATFILSLSYINCKPINNSQIVYAIDIGNQRPYESKEGILYQADQYYDSHSRVADYSGNTDYNTKPIMFADDVYIYYTERHADTDWGYKLPFKNQDDGVYVLIVKFCELYFQEADRRKTNIKIGKQVVEQGIDIVQTVGPFAAYDVFIEFELQNGKVIFQNQEIQGALTKKGELRIVFEKTEYDLPKADGLIVMKGSLKDSYQKEYNQIKSDWRDRVMEEERIKQQEKKKRDQARSILQEEFDASLDTAAHLGFIEGSIQLLQEPTGYIIIGLLVLFFICLKLTDLPEQQEEQKKEEYTEEELDEKKKN